MGVADSGNLGEVSCMTNLCLQAEVEFGVQIGARWAGYREPQMLPVSWSSDAHE